MSTNICTRPDCESDRAETGECHCSVYGDSTDEEIIDILLPNVQNHPERIARLERAVVLLARHVGATGWNKPLQEVLDAIQDDITEPW